MTNDDDRVSPRLIKAHPFVQIEVYHCRLCRQRSKAGESSPRQVLELAAGGIVAGGALGVASAGSGRLRQYRSEHPLDTEPEEL